MEKTVIQERITYWTTVHEKLQAAYIALIEGGVKQYSLDDRQLTRFNLGEIATRMEEAEKKIEEYEALLNGGGRRKSVAVVPRDW
mgnify:CR=1 FL=1